jgi:FdhE protein
VSAAPLVRPPDPPRRFAARAERLEALADGHAAGPWLRFLARLARGQEAAVREFRLPPRGRPALDPLWRAMLRVVLAEARDPANPAAARDALARLGSADDAALDGAARAVVEGAPVDLAFAPLVGAAVEACLASMAASATPAAAARPGECPACGGPPLASTLDGDGRLRWVHCARCATAWNAPRLHCVACGATAGISYVALEGGLPGVAAECCAGCRAYLKVFDLALVVSGEPCADDAATLVLDLLLAGEGWRRAGRNLLAPAGGPR